MDEWKSGRADDSDRKLPLVHSSIQSAAGLPPVLPLQPPAADLPDVVGDAHQLQQVFLNILNNAYDAVTETRLVALQGSVESLIDVFEDNSEMAMQYLQVMAQAILDILESRSSPGDPAAIGL